jgi:hypothetical protein
LAGRSSHQHSYDAITINTIQLNTTASSCYIPAGLSFKIIMTELGEHGKSRKKRAGLGDRPKEEMVANDKHIIKASREESTSITSQVGRRGCVPVQAAEARRVQ